MAEPASPVPHAGVRPLPLSVVALGAALAGAWFLVRGIDSLHLLEFGDETEKIVGARMIDAGGRLYRTVFSNHGPLLVALNHLWLVLTGANDVASHRLVQLGLFVLCALAVYASPALASVRARLYAVGLFLTPLGVVYAADTLHMWMYQGVGGAFLTMELVLFTVPALCGMVPPRWAAVASGFAAACAVFAAYPFAVPAALLAAAVAMTLPRDAVGGRGRAFVGFAAGALAAALAVGIWMARYADPAGYAVYHLWFNQVLYAARAAYSPLAPLWGLIRIDFGPGALTHTFAAALFFAAFGLLVAWTRRRAGALGVSSPHGVSLRELSRHRVAVKPSDDRIFRLIRRLLREDERFLAIVFAPAIYIMADRLPMSGQFYYLPLQAAYAKRPVWSYQIDLCRDVIAYRPKVVFYLDRLDSGRYGFADYAPCIHGEIVANYVRLPWAPDFLIRRDVAAARPEYLRE